MSMTTFELDRYLRTLLDLPGFSGSDNSMNGLQVDNDGKGISKVAFAVDACLETFERAAASGSGLLFVHHGLFWGSDVPVKAAHRARLKTLLDHNLALYAVHLPLDQSPQWGNNAALADLLGLEALEPFGVYHGKKIGYKGRLTKPLTVEEAAKAISFRDRPAAVVLPFGKKVNETCAVVSGGASMEAFQAIDEGVDLYITGEASHTVYHSALEAGMNFIAGGHYSTEVWGVRRIMERLALDTGIEVEFIDAPTGL